MSEAVGTRVIGLHTVLMTPFFINHHLLDLPLLRYDDHCLEMQGSSDMIPAVAGRRIIIEFKSGFSRVAWALEVGNCRWGGGDAKALGSGGLQNLHLGNVGIAKQDKRELSAVSVPVCGSVSCAC